MAWEWLGSSLGMLGTVTLYNILDELGIDYTEVTHPVVTTMEAAQFVKTLIDGTPIKNLFLTNRKGNYYLVLMSEDRRADLKALAQRPALVCEC